MGQSCHVTYLPSPNLQPTVLLKHSALTISLTHGTGYESHPPEVKLGKVVSGLLRGMDVLLLR